VQRHLRLQHPHLDVPAVRAGLAPGHRGVAALDPVEVGAQPAVGGQLEDAEVLAERAVAPAPGGARRPDDPELVGAAGDRVLQIGGAGLDGVDVEVPVDLDRREEDRQPQQGAAVERDGLQRLEGAPVCRRSAVRTCPASTWPA
jgi:hypothetical protein